MGWRSLLPIGLVVLMFLLPPVGPASNAAPASTPSRSAGTPLGAAGAPSSNSTLQCDGMYWASSIWANYSPSYCYGHDEPTVSYISTAPGSGADANFRFVLPADGGTYGQGDFYATIWFGGTVYDTASNNGGDQAFLEFQFYPAAPAFTGSNSGASDCLPDGAFNEVWGLGTNEWFACAIVWQLSNGVEDAGFAGPLDVAGSTDAILLMHSNDVVYLNYSGVAKSVTQGWKLSVNDTTAGLHGSVTLVNGSLVLSPEYSTASSTDTLSWGASNPGAIAFAYEIGHALDPGIPASCSPGDGSCDSYWPGRWAQAGQMDLELPVMGQSGSQTYPTQVKFSSSQGGENEVNSTCGAPSFSSSTNCLYPWYQYRSGSYGFTFDTSNVTNETHNYGWWYQFPATTNGLGQWNGNFQTAPWGTVRLTVSPLTATVDFNRHGQTNPLSVASNGTAGGQFEEGPYWLNVSAPGCTPISTFVYVSTKAADSLPAELSCGGSTPLSVTGSGLPLSGASPLEVNFTATPSGGATPYTYSWNFGDTGTSTQQDPSHNYTAAGTYNAVVTVTDHNGDTAAASVKVTVSPALAVSASANRTSGNAPLAVQFYSTPTGGSGGNTYAWTFGDGGTSTAQNPAYTYLAAGSYTARVNVTDSSHQQASATVAITVTPTPLYAVQFNESGLPSGTDWTVTLSGSTQSTTGTNVSFSAPDGPHAYTVSVANTSYHPTLASGSVTVSGAPVYLTVLFVRTNYSITFTASSLPPGTSWAVDLGGQLLTTTLSQAVFERTNGSYTFTVTQPPGFSALPLTGLANVSGANVAKSVAFTAIPFRVSFSLTGLPSGSLWNVSFAGQHGSSTGNWTNFSVTDGTYSYSASTIGGYRVSPASGSVTVNLANQSVALTASEVLYAVTFTETGLANGTSWTVNVGGVVHTTSSRLFNVSLANGSYRFSVTVPSGYALANVTGTVHVSAGPASVTLPFTRPGSSNSGSGFLTGNELYLALAAVAVLVAGTVIYAVGARRRKRDSEPPPPPSGAS